MTRLASWADFGTHDESAYPELWRGCVGAWAPCLGPTGTRLHDLSVYHNWGTLTNMVPADDWMVSGGRYALDFDVSDDIVDCGTGIYTGGSLTVTGWMCRSGTGASNNNVICAKGSMNGDSTSTFALYYNTSLGWSWFCVNASNSLFICRSLTFTSLDTWYFVCGTFSPNGLRLYINGSEVASATGGTVKESTHATTLGRSGSIGGNCLLDDIRVIRRELSPAEIRLLAIRRGIAYERRTRHQVYFDAAFFNPAWARNSNVILSPVGAA